MYKLTLTGESAINLSDQKAVIIFTLLMEE